MKRSLGIAARRDPGIHETALVSGLGFRAPSLRAWLGRLDSRLLWRVREAPELRGTPNNPYLCDSKGLKTNKYSENTGADMTRV